MRSDENIALPEFWQPARLPLCGRQAGASLYLSRGRGRRWRSYLWTYSV